jgi:hypothetical protein
VILGTAAYMSPEQARGQPVDRRADVWAFGCVVYEMLTGRREFDGESISDTLAAVLKSEPDYGALPVETPPRLREILRRCLEKDLRHRRRDMGDLRCEIGRLEGFSAAVEAGASAEAAERAGFRRKGRAAWLVAGLAALGLVLASAGWWTERERRGGPLSLQALDVTLGEGEALRIGEGLSVALSPDGRLLAYVSDESGRDEIYVERLQPPGERVQVSSDGGTEPRWGRNGQEVSFRDGNRMMAAAVSAQPALRASGAKIVFEGEHEYGGAVIDYAVSADRRRFLMMRGTASAADPTRIRVLVNWERLLESAPAPTDGD